MKIQLKKSGGFLYGADPLSKQAIKKLKGESFKCDVTKEKGEVTEDIRSLAQNRLLYAFFEDMEKTQANEHAGNTAGDWRDIMRYEILFDMYVNNNIGGFADAVWPHIRHYTSEQYTLAKWEIVKAKDAFGNAAFVSTKTLTISQFTLYLREIERWCHWRGIDLRTDDWLRNMAGLSDE